MVPSDKIYKVTNNMVELAKKKSTTHIVILRKESFFYVRKAVGSALLEVSARLHSIRAIPERMEYYSDSQRQKKQAFSECLL